MEPWLGYRRRLQVQLAGSALAGGVLGILVRVALGVPWSQAMLFAVPLALAAAPLSSSAAFLCRALPLSRTPALRVGLAAAGAAVVAGGVWAAAGYGWWTLLTWNEWEPGDVPMRTLVALVAEFGGPLYLFSVAGHYLMRAFEDSAEASRRVLASEVAHRDAELRALRAQIDPHFLFNSLNSIAGLTTADPPRAREMCQLLAEFLRESLDVGASPSIALGREVALAEQYLRIERVRFGSRLSVTTSIAPGAAEAQVPPLLLQPLVENAVRHGIATRIEGGAIEVAVLRSGEHVLIDVHNPKDSDGARPGTGRGLELVRRRLAATFGPRAHLAVSSTEDAFHVRLSIPATAGPAADAVRALAATLPGEAPAASRSRDADRSGRRAESRPAASEAEAR